MESPQNKVKNMIAPLKQVTPLSKYLAMVIFIVMPFVGGWIGYQYAHYFLPKENSAYKQETQQSQSDYKLQDGLIDFGLCEPDMETGGWEGIDVVYVLGESRFDDMCHVMIYSASALGDGGYQVQECWVPMSLGVASSTKYEPYDDVFLAPSIPSEYCTVSEQQGIFLDEVNKEL